MKGADIAFPNIGIYFSNVPKSVSVAGFQIAFYGIIIACGMLLGIVMARWNAKGRAKIRISILILLCGEFCLLSSEPEPTM